MLSGQTAPQLQCPCLPSSCSPSTLSHSLPMPSKPCCMWHSSSPSLRGTTKSNTSISSDSSSSASTQSAPSGKELSPTRDASAASRVVYSVPSHVGPHPLPPPSTEEHIYDEPSTDCDKVSWLSSAPTHVRTYAPNLPGTLQCCSAVPSRVSG